MDNVFEAFDAPGTWYLDRKQGLLSYRPAPGEDVDKLCFVAPVAEQLVRLEGDASAGRCVRHVILRGTHPQLSAERINICLDPVLHIGIRIEIAITAPTMAKGNMEIEVLHPILLGPRRGH